jgi:HK97 family phage major capsid protein
MTVKTIEELQSELADAELAMNTADAALQAVDPKDKDTREELDAEFRARTEEVSKLADDVRRKEDMHKALAAVPKNSGIEVGQEPRTYERGIRENDGKYRSFFRDVLNAQKGDHSAQTRIARHSREMAVEQRAMNTGTQGVGLVPPQYLQAELAEFARAGRPFADALGGRPLPDTGMTFNVPRVTTGTTTAVQSAEAGTVQDNTPVTDTIALAVNTVAGKVDISQQLLDRSDPATDTVIGQDLAADYAKQLDTQLITQATNGILNVSGVNSVTAGSVGTALVWKKIADGVQQIWTGRFAGPDLILFHPRRWADFLQALDAQSRPYVVPDAMAGVQSFNALAAATGNTPMGLVGQVQGLPVLLDPNIPTNLGTNTNEDRIIITKRTDALLFESGAPTIRVMSEVLSGTLQVRILAFGYFAFTFARYPKATSIISGAALVAPTFT